MCDEQSPGRMKGWNDLRLDERKRNQRGCCTVTTACACNLPQDVESIRQHVFRTSEHTRLLLFWGGYHETTAYPCRVGHHFCIADFCPTNKPDPKLREQMLAFVTKFDPPFNNGDAAALAPF